MNICMNICLNVCLDVCNHEDVSMSKCVGVHWGQYVRVCVNG